MPAKHEIISYAKPIIFKFINKFAVDLPQEQKLEIEQTAYLRLLEAYDQINPDLGWKSFTFNHSRGAVLDYLKFGKGFAESKWSIRKEEGPQSRHRNKIKERVFHESTTGEELDIDQVLGQLGIFSDTEPKALNINWDLVARMAAYDKEIHATAKWIRGFQIDEIATIFGVSRSKITQLIASFVFRFDDPECAVDKWFLQTCYAFGLCGHLGLPTIDQSRRGEPVGWSLPPVDLDSNKPQRVTKEVQLAFVEMA